MTKSQIQSSWRKIINESRKRSKLVKQLKEEKISRLGDLLLCAQVILGKIESGENNAFNTLIFEKTMNFYCEQMKKYV